MSDERGLGSRRERQWRSDCGTALASRPSQGRGARARLCRGVWNWHVRGISADDEGTENVRRIKAKAAGERGERRTCEVTGEGLWRVCGSDCDSVGGRGGPAKLGVRGWRNRCQRPGKQSPPTALSNPSRHAVQMRTAYVFLAIPRASFAHASC
eukprot:6192460-Pleurochrysis_carterae.AAC.1